MAMRSLIPRSWDDNAPSTLRQDPFRVLRSEMDRLFESFPWSGHGSASVSPRLDVCETENEIDIDAELPGLEGKDIDLSVSGDLLTIRGEKKGEREEKQKNYHVSERSYGSFARSIRLPFNADPGKISAKFDKGVLHIAVPKPPELASKSAKIEVKSS